MNSNQTKFTLITGGTTGIGYELSLNYAKQGKSLILVARNNELLEKISTELKKQYHIEVEIFNMDLSEQGNVEKLYNICHEKKLFVETLINNAGFGLYGDFVDLPWEEQLKMMNLNILALTRMTYLFAKDMKLLKSGNILNVASIAGFFPAPTMAIYHASKAFVLSFTRALNVELKREGINVSALCPGYTSSNFQKTAGLEGMRLINFTLLSSKKVAKIALKYFKKNKAIIITGVINKFLVNLGNFLPKSWNTHLTGLFWKQWGK